MAAKGFRYARFGSMASVVNLESFTLPSNEVSVAVKSAPLHRADAAVIGGSVSGGNVNQSKKEGFNQFPRVAGSEAFGTVTEASSSAGVKKGDSVWVAPPFGGWANNVSAPSSAVHPVDAKFSKVAPFISALLTANQLLKAGKVQKSGVVIQNGGSSAVALGVSAIAKEKGVKVVTAATPGTSRFDAAVARHKKFGSEVVEYNNKGMLKAASILGKGVGANLYLNGVGGRSFNDFVKLMAEDGGGQIITYGAQNGHGLEFGLSNQIYRQISHRGFNLNKSLASMTKEQRQAELVEVLELATKINFDYPVKAISGLDKLPEVWDEVFLAGGSKAVLQL